MNDINALFQSILGWIRQVASMYTTYLILAFPLVLWILRKVVNFFRKVLP